VHPDGTSGDSLNSLNPSFDLYPSPSPDGQQLVYATILSDLQNWSCQSTIGIVNADGTGSHSLTTDTYQGELDWSPDGQWIVAYNVTTGHIDVLNASSGQTLPLTFTSGLSSPSWLPTAPQTARVRQRRR
jgi:Tol biopolymer transport system component